MSDTPDFISIMSPEAMLGFHALFTAKAATEGGDKKFSATLIFTPEAQKTEEFAAMKAAASAAARKKWGDKVPSGIRNPFRPCSEKPKYYSDLPEGSVYINASTEHRPGVVKHAGNGVEKVLDENEVYSGVFVRAKLNPYAYDNTGNRGVSFGLGNVLLVRKGERRGGRPAAEDDFKDFAKANPGAAAGSAEGLF
jgi:hypothetical protein